MRSSPTGVAAVDAPDCPQLAEIEALLDTVRALEGEVARLRGRQAAAIADLDRRIPAFFPDAVREELMVACRITEAQARRRHETARALAGRLRHTREALERGRISFEHAVQMADATSRLDPAQTALVETEVLDDPRAVTPGQLGWRARQAAERLVPLDPPVPDPRWPARSLDAYWHPDGTVDYGLHLPPAEAAVVATWVGSAGGRSGPEDHRRPTERRADALVALIRQALDTGQLPAAGDARRPHVDLLADVDQLRADATGHVLVNGRPLPGKLLRELVCEPDLRLSVTCDDTLADQGRSHRLVTPALRGRLAVRDQHCRFPGCDQRPRACRAHHIVHWADGGSTDLANLLLLCSRHHAAVHGGWQVRLEPDATVTWTSPGGQRISQESDLRYLVEPEDLTDSELETTHPHHPGWVRPWWEYFCLDRPPPEPRAEPSPPSDDGPCPF
ncbi:MAG TPA: DUF222 domain-containing protein [Mycobacteriales bacterium]